ncbi:MAG: hypothetical protein FWB75_01360 [Oscillospiraceae bacterium]|nr:hypothetical protein [Oscillospiraceae bacterium]
MSNKDRCMAMIDSFTESQLANVITLLTSAKTLADEAADDAHCERIYNEYEQDPDKGEPISIEAFAEQLGVSL